MGLVDPSRWLRQARSDFDAARVNEERILECHRRYWFQQSYEKAIKAIAIASISDADEEFLQAFQDYFLRHHAPVFSFKLKTREWEGVEEELRGKFPKTWESISNRLRLLRRSLEQLETKLTQRSTLQQIETTTPSLSPNDVSYRYPFFEQANRPETAIAPADFRGWAAYQGDEQRVTEAIQELLDCARATVSVAKFSRAKRRRH